MALDPPVPGQQEFYRPAVIVPELGNPALDPPMTCRMQPPDTWERRYDPATPRVVKIEREDRLQWIRVSGADLPWRTDDEVADWPVQHPFWYRHAYRKLVPQQAEQGPAKDVEGDMDVESFRG